MSHPSHRRTTCPLGPLFALVTACYSAGGEATGTESTGDVNASSGSDATNTSSATPGSGDPSGPGSDSDSTSTSSAPTTTSVDPTTVDPTTVDPTTDVDPSSPSSSSASTTETTSQPDTTGPDPGTTASETTGDPPDPVDGPPAGNPDGQCAVPAEAGPADSSKPTTVVGNGSPESCTSAAFVAAVAKGGVITFDCGPDPVTITLAETAKIFNDTGPEIVIDGGGKVTLSGGGQRRILYQNTCDEAQHWTTAHCDDQDHPRLTVQNLTFEGGNAKGEDPDGGGAIFVRGGRFRVVNSRFFGNVCDDVGPDVGGGAIRVLDQHEDKPVYIVKSTFGGEPELGNVCSNGGGLSSIGVSYTVLNSLFRHNRAIGDGANPAQPNTPGGGSGGAIYNDGNTFTLTLCGTDVRENTANEGGGAIFFVSNDLTGELVIQDSVLCENPSAGFETDGYPGIFVLAQGDPQVDGATITAMCPG